MSRSGSLAAWARAWIVGRISLDEVVDAVTGADAPHAVAGVQDFGAPVPLREVLVDWRRIGEPILTVLPVPGDVRGLPGPAKFRAAALHHGEAVVCGGIAVTPEVTERAPSSAPPAVLWHAFAVEAAPVDHQSVADAQYDLTTAIRESASALRDLATPAAAPTDALQGARRAGERINLPPGYPPPAVALLAQAQRLAAVLELAFAGRHDAARAETLRPLATAVRRAQLTAYNATAFS